MKEILIKLCLHGNDDDNDCSIIDGNDGGSDGVNDDSDRSNGNHV